MSGYKKGPYECTKAACGKCKYYSGSGWGCPCCHYTLYTKKIRPHTPVAECPVREIGPKVKINASERVGKNARIVVQEDLVW